MLLHQVHRVFVIIIQLNIGIVNKKLEYRDRWTILRPYLHGGRFTLFLRRTNLVFATHKIELVVALRSRTSCKKVLKPTRTRVVYQTPWWSKVLLDVNQNCSDKRWSISEHVDWWLSTKARFRCADSILFYPKLIENVVETRQEF